jgi:hypothetical protein
MMLKTLKISNGKIPPTRPKGLGENWPIFAGYLTLVGGILRLLFIN